MYSQNFIHFMLIRHIIHILHIQGVTDRTDFGITFVQMNI